MISKGQNEKCGSGQGRVQNLGEMVKVKKQKKNIKVLLGKNQAICCITKLKIIVLKFCPTFLAMKYFEDLSR